VRRWKRDKAPSGVPGGRTSPKGTPTEETGNNKRIEKFEDLEVWKKSVRLSISIYNELKNCKDYGLRDQIQRSAVSIPSNIAEGYERNTNKEYIQFLHIAPVE